MRLEQIFEEQDDQQEPGTYIGVKLTDQSVNDIIEYCNENDIPNPLTPDKLHITVIYSRVPAPDIDVKSEYDPPITAEFKEYSIWESKNDDDSVSKCLVMQINCEELVSRHEYIMDNYGTTFDYDSYNPHVTLSYNVGDEFDVEKLSSFDKTIELSGEYMEDLKLDWAETHK